QPPPSAPPRSRRTHSPDILSPCAGRNPSRKPRPPAEKRADSSAALILASSLDDTASSRASCYIQLMQRRSFLSTPLAAFQLAAAAPDDRIYASGDGIPLKPGEYAQLLVGLVKANDYERADYSRGAVVE